jgi:23S rRNA pseudouridine2605 synthase
MSEKIRLQKIMASAGLGSRRSCEVLIAEGRVRLNGRVAHLGDQADPLVDSIEVNGERLHWQPPKFRYIAFNKPRGVLCDRRSLGGAPTVFDLVPKSEGLFLAGRLDKESEGLVLLSNDGELVYRLTHPRYKHEKEYSVLVARRPDEEQLQIWRRGVVLADGSRTAPAQVAVADATKEGAWLDVVLHEGKKREIREIGRTIGLPVLRIVRTRIANITTRALGPGEWRHLSDQELQDLRAAVGRETLAPSRRRKQRAPVG